MRVRVAYISSFGTTAVLVAAAVLMLGVVGAIVGFHGWPGSATESGVESVPLAPNSASERSASVRRTAARRSAVRTRATPRAARASTTGLVKQSSAPLVPGLVMVPISAAPMQPATPHSGGGGNAPADAPAPASAPPTDVAPGTAAPQPVPDPQGTVPVPLPAVPPLPGLSGDDGDGLVAMVDALLGSPPAPGAAARR